MTCVSLRSGIASSGMLRADHQPATTAAAVSRNTRNGLRADQSMTRLIIGSMPQTEPAFGIEQKVAGRYDPLACLEPFENLDAIGVPLAGLHLSGLQVSVAEIDKYG